MLTTLTLRGLLGTDRRVVVGQRRAYRQARGQTGAIVLVKRVPVQLLTYLITIPRRAALVA